ncbi:MAG: tetratricopeptide repeat protein [Desulfovibrio sp.]
MKKTILTFCCLLLLTGCLPLQGRSLLQEGSYEQGLSLAKQAVAQDPHDPEANYYAARFLLATDRPKEALPFIQKAATLDPGEAEYHFWLGVTHWALFDFDAERAEYLRAVNLDPDHISAHLYLGHSHLDAGEWRAALREYDTVLELREREPGAMYNRAVALDRLGREQEARSALLDFMLAYPDGDMAISAVEQLNAYGDFSYRNFILGKRTVPLRAISFEPGTSRLGFDVRSSLDVLGAMLENNQALHVHIVAYADKDAPLARMRAERVQRYITIHFPKVSAKRLLLSWFGRGEVVHTSEWDYRLPESVNLITEAHERPQ